MLINSAIFVGLEMPSYTVREDAGELDDLIYIIKEPQGVQTESLLEVELQILATGSSTPAEEGLYIYHSLMLAYSMKSTAETFIYNTQ